MRTYDGSFSVVTEDVWLGLQRDIVASPWQWIRNGRHPGPDKEGDWGEKDPNGDTDLCVRGIAGDKFLAGDRVCSELLKYVCEIWQ